MEECNQVGAVVEVDLPEKEVVGVYHHKVVVAVAVAAVHHHKEKEVVVAAVEHWICEGLAEGVFLKNGLGVGPGVGVEVEVEVQVVVVEKHHSKEVELL